jgi:hypothetical protein
VPPALLGQTDVGFFERRGTAGDPDYWVPFLYRDALGLVQGEARLERSHADGEYVYLFDGTDTDSRGLNRHTVAVDRGDG